MRINWSNSVPHLLARLSESIRWEKFVYMFSDPDEPRVSECACTILGARVKLVIAILKLLLGQQQYQIILNFGLEPCEYYSNL